MQRCFTFSSLAKVTTPAPEQGTAGHVGLGPFLRSTAECENNFAPCMHLPVNNRSHLGRYLNPIAHARHKHMLEI
jgi:hypothetical protein